MYIIIATVKRETLIHAKYIYLYVQNRVLLTSSVGLREAIAKASAAEPAQDISELFIGKTMTYTYILDYFKGEKFDFS